ncbi:MAG TPA: DinB family protein [Symbiobacteriaceae bacterium]|nr:DinB family protein [Symbiobacteriaceae bacterium]
MREVLQVRPLSGYPDEIGRWLWAMRAVRGKTLWVVEGLDQAALDWEGPDGRENSIGSLLYHIAGVEIGWLYTDILGQKFPPEVERELPFDRWTTEGGMGRVTNASLADHMGRLERIRSIFLDTLSGMTLDDWRRLRSPEGENYDVTPEWAIFHLVEHEAGHTAQISSLKRRARHFFGHDA